MFEWEQGTSSPSYAFAREAALARTLDEIHIRVFANGAQEVDMLWTIFVVLLILWLLGFSLHIGGSLIHLLLVVGLVVLVINLLSGRRSVV
jgi:fatty acid desaturase